MTTTRTTTAILPKTIIIFKPKSRKKSYSQKKEQQFQPALYHAAYKIRLEQSTVKSLCGFTCYIDWGTEFEIISLDDEITKGIYFTEDCKQTMQQKTRDITSQLCRRCHIVICDMLLQQQEVNKLEKHAH
jgi:hypothetical protein